MMDGLRVAVRAVATAKARTVLVLGERLITVRVLAK